MLNAFEGLEGQSYRVAGTPCIWVCDRAPIKFFVTCETLPVKYKEDKSAAGGDWEEDEEKTKHFHNRLAIHGPFKPLSVITDAGDKPCAKQFCQWLLDNKDVKRAPSLEEDIFNHPDDSS
jgi:hypothetical protein